MRPLVIALTVLACLSAAPARAAVTIGDSASPPSSGTSGAGVYLQTASGNGKSYAAPTNGVVTSVSLRASTSSGTATVRALFARSVSGSTYKVVAGADLIATTSSMPVPTVSTRIPVQAGDILGFFLPSGVNFSFYNATGASADAQATASPPVDGAPVTVSYLTSSNLLVSAVLERDGDGDGFGDETQDSCPTLPAVHSGPCATDLRVTMGASPTSVETGQSAAIVATVVNAGPQTAFATQAALTLPTGLDVLAASTTGGECGETTCALGDIPAGANRKVYLLVRGTAVGTPSVGVSVSSTIADTAPSDNSASQALTVTAPPAVSVTPSPTPAPTTTPTPATDAPVDLCTVPRLKGKTRKAARKAIAKADCTTGRIRGPRKGKVRRQTIPAGTQVLAGTKVGFRLRK